MTKNGQEQRLLQRIFDEYESLKEAGLDPDDYRGMFEYLMLHDDEVTYDLGFHDVQDLVNKVKDWPRIDEDGVVELEKEV